MEIKQNFEFGRHLGNVSSSCREISSVKCVAETSDDSDGLPCAQKKTCFSSSNESSIPNARSVIPAAESAGNANKPSGTDVSGASSFKILNPSVVAQQEVEAGILLIKKYCKHTNSFLFTNFPSYTWKSKFLENL